MDAIVQDERDAEAPLGGVSGGDPSALEPVAESRSWRRVSGAHRMVRALELALAGGAVISLILLGLRAYMRVDLKWDSWMYHIPFAALRGGLHIPYQFNEQMRPVWEGFPPLPEFVMGVLWRITGTIHATGVVNYLALVAFLGVCQRKLRAPFYVVAPIALTAPLVVIHAASAYVDLFSNSFLAVGLSALACAYLFDRRDSLSLLAVGLAGLVGTAWCKMLLMPVVALGFLLYFAVYRPWRVADRRQRSRVVVFFLAAIAISALPYAKNTVLYGNPVWPVAMPVIGAHLPHGPTQSLDYLRPPSLAHASQPELFLRSLFEVGHPTHYPDRVRWTIDQRSAGLANRSGGYWNVAVVFYLGVAAGMLTYLRGRKGLVVCLAAIGVLGVVAITPESHELRYFLFIPLCWAALVGMLYPLLKKRRPVLGVSLLVVVASLFLYMGQVNASYYKQGRISYKEAAHAKGVDVMWPQLRPGFTYCVIDRVASAMFFTGPTMHEFTVVDRTHEQDCPSGSVPVRGNTVFYDERR